MKSWISIVLELERGEYIGVGSGQGTCAADSPAHAFCFRSALDSGSKATHQYAFFFGISFGHEQHNLVAAVDADQSQPNPGIARRGFHNCRSGLQDAPHLCIENHAERGAIFYAAAWV